MNNQISRRSFLKGSAAAMLGTAAMTSLPAFAEEEEKRMFEEGQFAFEIPPEPVPEDEIIAEYEADVVVVGAGIGGAAATLAAAQEGASVLVLQKWDSPMTHGIGIAAFDTNAQHANGNGFDIDEVTDFLVKQAYGYGDQDVIKAVLEGGRDCINMFEDALKDKGWGFFIAAYSPLTEEGCTAIHLWNDVDTTNGYSRVPLLNRRICTICEEEYGVQYLFETPGKYLEKDENGRVCAVIAQNEEGYIRAKANKGVILATGDIMNNPQMVKRWAPFNVGAPCTYAPPINTGDGHAMGLWAGAKMNKGPFAQAIHFDPSALPCGDAPFSGSPYFAINKHGKRYQNEDLPYPIIANTCIRQPDSMRFQIVDASFTENWNDLGNGMCRNAGFEFNSNEEALEASLKNGAIFKADTIDELLDILGFEGQYKENALASIARYQELVEKGFDEDFRKNPEYLVRTPIKDAPFYGIPRKPGNLALLDGFVCTPTMQLIDENLEYIPGLFACGNTVGNFFDVDYTLSIGGISIGHAIGSGYVAGKSAAKA